MMSSATLLSPSASAVSHKASRKAPARGAVFSCPLPACPKTFRRRLSLKEHVATHTGEKAYVCAVSSCGRCFSTSGNLARHRRMQHPWLDVPLECPVDDCGCTFASVRKLERHMAMVHFSGSSHACAVKHCGCAFTTAGNLRRHMKQQHANDLGDSTTKMVFSPTAIDISTVEPINKPHQFLDATLQDTDLMDALACLFE